MNSSLELSATTQSVLSLTLGQPKNVTLPVTTSLRTRSLISINTVKSKETKPLKQVRFLKLVWDRVNEIYCLRLETSVSII